MSENPPDRIPRDAVAAEPVRAVPATREQLETLLSGEAAFEREFGLGLAPGYVQHDGALEYSLDALRLGADPRWSTHLFILPEQRMVIGIGGFAAPPADGAVEIGYSIAPGYLGRGFATQAASQLVSAARSGGLSKAVAHTLASTGPSTRILEKLGFTRTAELSDPDDGPVWRWELRLDDPA